MYTLILKILWCISWITKLLIPTFYYKLMWMWHEINYGHDAYACYLTYSTWQLACMWNATNTEGQLSPPRINSKDALF